MIKHIVMWNLRGESGGLQKPELAVELKSRLEALKNDIAEIRDLEVGINEKDSDASCDVVLYSSFDSHDALAAYQVHPSHQQVAGYLREIALDRHVVDYQTDD